MDTVNQLYQIQDHDSIVVTSAQGSCDLKGETVILNMSDGQYYGLDEIGSRIWNMVQQPITFAEVRDRLMQEFDVEKDSCTADVTELLQELESKKLVEIRHTISATG